MNRAVRRRKALDAADTQLGTNMHQLSAIPEEVLHAIATNTEDESWMDGVSVLQTVQCDTALATQQDATDSVAVAVAEQDDGKGSAVVERGGAKRKAREIALALSSTDVCMTVQNNVTDSTLKKYRSAQPLFADYCSENQLDIHTAGQLIGDDGLPRSDVIVAFIQYCTARVHAGTIVASMVYNGKSQGTAINWAQDRLKMQRKEWCHNHSIAASDKHMRGFICNLTDVVDCVKSLADDSKEMRLQSGQSVQRQLRTHVTHDAELLMYHHLLNFSLHMDALLSLQTRFEMIASHRIGCRCQVFRNLRMPHVFPGPLRSQIGAKGMKPLRLVVTEGKTLKDPYEYVEMVPHRNPAICGIAAYGYCLMWRFTPECGLLEDLPAFCDKNEWHQYFYRPVCRARLVKTMQLGERLLTVRPVTYDVEKEGWLAAYASAGLSDMRMLTHHFRRQMQLESGLWRVTALLCTLTIHLHSTAYFMRYTPYRGRRHRQRDDWARSALRGV